MKKTGAAKKTDAPAKAAKPAKTTKTTAKDKDKEKLTHKSGASNVKATTKAKEPKEKKEPKEHKEPKESKESKETKETKEPPKESKDSSKELPKEPPKESKDSSKELPKEPPKEPPKESKDSSKELPKEIKEPEPPSPTATPNEEPQDTPPVSSSSSIQQPPQIQPTFHIDTSHIEEKKEFLRQISQLKKENVDLKKRCDEMDKLNNELMNEVEQSQKSSEQMLKERKEIESTRMKAVNDYKELSKQHEDLKKELSNLKEDMEIINEELSMKDLEIELAEKKFNDYKEQIEQQRKDAKNQQKQETPQQAAPQSSDPNQPPSAEQQAKISELEDVITELSSQLKTTSEQRDYAVAYYKEQIDKLTAELEESKKNIAIIAEKDDLLRQLTDKLKDEEAIIEALNSQISALSPANDMYEQIIIEKDELETQIEELKAENEKLKEEIQNEEEMVNDLETSLKISEQMMRQSQNESLNAKKKEGELLAVIKEFEDKEKALVEKIGELKQINKIIKEEVTKYQDTNMNIDDVLNKNLTTTSRMQTYQRQSVLIPLSTVELDKLILRNKVIHSMIPQKMLQKGSIEVFERFLNIQTIRKKTLELILSLIENYILTEDLLQDVTVSNNKLDEIEGENAKKIVQFYADVILVLTEYNIILYKIEIHLSKLNADEFKEFPVSEGFDAIYSNIMAASSFIETLINMIRDDKFSNIYASCAASLKTLTTTIKQQLADFPAITSDTLYEYMNVILLYFVNLSINCKTERIDELVRGSEESFAKLIEVGNNFFIMFKNIKRLLTRINQKFFDDIKYESSEQILDINSSYFTAIVTLWNKAQQGNAGEDNEAYASKYNNAFDSLNKLCVLIIACMEKFEKENEKDDQHITLEATQKLPLTAWYSITNELNTELQEVAQMKDQLDESAQKVKQVKIEKAELEAKYAELARSKDVNDRKLGELEVKVGKISQLESANEEYAKRIEKYKIAVEGLQKTAEDNLTKYKEYKAKYEKVASREKEDKRGSLHANTVNMSAIAGMGSYAPIINTVYVLQKERKSLKSKLMKDKLVSLIEDNDSYMNKFIKKDMKISKNESERDFYKRIEDNVNNLNTNYHKMRNQLCLPKVYDLSKDNYNYEQQAQRDEAAMTQMRIDYMKDANKILFKMFGDNSPDKTFTDVIDNDIDKTLQLYSQKKIKVGELTFMEGVQKGANDVNAGKRNKVPLMLSEESLKLLNKTFVH